MVGEGSVRPNIALPGVVPAYPNFGAFSKRLISREEREEREDAKAFAVRVSAERFHEVRNLWITSVRGQAAVGTRTVAAAKCG